MFALIALGTAALALALDIADRTAARRPERSRFPTVIGGAHGFGLEGF